MKIKRCTLADLSTLIDIISDDDNISLLIIRSKMQLPSVFILTNEDNPNYFIAYELVSEGVALVHVYAKKGISLKEIKAFGESTVEYMKKFGCKLFIAIKEPNRFDVGMLISAAGGQRVYTTQDSRAVYFREES